MEIAGIYSKRASRGCCKQQQQQENIVHCGRYCCGETISSYTTLEIPEKRLPLCGQSGTTYATTKPFSKLAL